MSAVPLQTPLHALHQACGARFVPFAGYDMPVQFPSGVLAEHLWTREKAGLFDVSHMGQIRIDGVGAAAALERLVPGDLASLAPGQSRYGVFINEAGGIIDDLMVTNRGDHLFLVVNAANKAADLAHLKGHLPESLKIEPPPDLALLALQGPLAAGVLARIAPGVEGLGFMTGAEVMIADIPAWVTRSGYTGEDGFEISLGVDTVETVAQILLAAAEVAPIGLGARDSLRLEAGLCLHGHDIDATTTPIEAGLAWTIPARRRAEGGFPGADIILDQLAKGPRRRRVGILPEGKAPAREGTEITSGGKPIGTITSGGFGPSVGGPIAMGYVDAAHAAIGTPIELTVRGTPRPGRVAALPFIPHRYHRRSAP
jgi:aminomethyltransferase